MNRAEHELELASSHCRGEAEDEWLAGQKALNAFMAEAKNIDDDIKELMKEFKDDTDS